ncbi:hypothetical protein LPJ63_002830 [Coemansia sp. RSA 2711]|nr:hypothetical protein LPJ63_002830 [Coemansia sp. RSA 2711]
MSYLPTQPVGERVRFQSQMSTPGLHGASDLLTPTRPGSGTATTPFRTTLRRSALLEPEPHANPFTPRVDRGLSPAGSRLLARRTTTLTSSSSSTAANGAAGGDRMSSLYQTDTPAPGRAADSGMQGVQSTQPFAATEYPALGGVGGWPADSAAFNDSEPSPKSPFSRPKSPAKRSASPHRNSKQLPSFLLGSMQPAKSPGASTSYVSDSARSGGSTAAVSIFSIPSAQPLSSRPVSPRVSRRLSGFGSNDMLSSAYRSSSSAAASRVGGAASSLDDAPPILTLDDMDVEQPGSDRLAAQPAETDVFDVSPERSVAGARSLDAADAAVKAQVSEEMSEQDYNDVRVRAVVVSDLPPRAESNTLNYFRSFGEILAFSAVPAGTATDRLALLFSEPWQAQRAVAQADAAGQILLDGRIVARVDWADAVCVALLFTQVFPGRPLPSAAAPARPDTFTFSQTIYAQSPRRQPPAPPRGRSRVEAVQESELRGTASPGSPFANRRALPRSTPASASTVMATASAQASVLNSSAPPKPRNGLLQSVLDILFGW